MTFLADNSPALEWMMAAKVFRAYDGLRRAGLLSAFEHPVAPEEVAKTHQLDASVLIAVLRLLVKAGLFEVAGGQYALSGDARRYKNLFEIECFLSEAMESGGGLAAGLTGRRFDPLDHIVDPGFFNEYAAAMRANARPLALSIMRSARIAPDTVLLDLGASDGSLLRELLMIEPTLTGVAFDRPMMRREFNKQMSQGDFKDRLRFAAGDLTIRDDLIDALPGKGAVIMSNVAHLISEAGLSSLFATICSNADRNALFVVYDMFPPEDGKVSLQDLLSIDWASGGVGFYRTAQEFADWLGVHGFCELRTAKTPLLPGALITGVVR